MKDLLSYEKKVVDSYVYGPGSDAKLLDIGNLVLRLEQLHLEIEKILRE